MNKFVKLIVINIILVLLSYTFLGLVNINNVEAAQKREAYSSKINNYPGYKELIDKLKKDHPNWNFTILYTGLDWNTVIEYETTDLHGRNLVPNSRTSAWKCDICGDKPYSGGSWNCASKMAVSYYIDPRNWLNDTYVFQFENLAYNGSIQNIQGVQKIISGIKYMQGNKVTYTKTDGTKATLNKSYAQVIMDAAKDAGISPYHLASRIRQEQGAGATPGSTATGTYGGYVGYYNFLNIKAYGGTQKEVIENGLTHAKNNNWTDPETSIREGAKVLAQNYIKVGQDTLYLQKFDVDNSDGSLYWHQYMQNVSAVVSEGSNVKKAYEGLGLLNSSIDFVIPVYENMPKTACEEPSESKTFNVSYRTHVQNVGWQGYVRNGATAGTTGKYLRLEGINIKLENSEYSGGITYQTHVQNIGWQNYVKDGEMSGTSGASLRLEAIRIKLTGEVANHYDVYYRVHCENVGWMDWAKNGEDAGSSGYSYRLEGIQIRLVKKGVTAPGSTKKPFIQKYVRYQTHVQNIGWQNQVFDNQMSGTSGQSLRLEGIKILLENPKYDGNIEYRTHVQNVGWQGFVKNGAMSGTEGKSLRLEAIQIRLTGTMAQKYDVYYRVHCQQFGWMGWAKNGQSAGSSGYSYRLEGIEICFVDKGAPAPGSTANCFKSK